ncbi:MAG: DNA-processing protein DprA [archaeon]|nr:DNA-processing protein DprA [archaeon]
MSISFSSFKSSMSEMDMSARPSFSSVSPQELLGRPLNEVEEKYAPKVLYIATRKEIPIPRPRTAIIGSRKASEKSKTTAAEISAYLAQKGVVIVSGLAEGIDTAAHVAAIKAGGRTVAVLGTSLDKSYPAKNAELQKTIMQNHWVISQFPEGYPTTQKNFVIRNRTMALISDASIIMEAGETSGSLHQGWETLRLGRPLFLWTTLVNNPSLEWPRKMMEYGAIELKDVEQVFDVLPSSQRMLKILS